ncbi:hypothetical protein Tco_0553044, partial [Tanacetum coccineum]
MTTLPFADTHNLVAFLDKPAESKGFEQIVDFLNASSIRYALTIKPTIYTLCIQQWATVKVKTVNGEVQLQALVDGKKIIITKSTIRRDLQLEDAEGIDCLPNATIFEKLTLMGSTPLLPFPCYLILGVLHKLQQRGLDLENTKTAKRVKKLEKKGGLRTHKLKRLYKIGRSARVVSSEEANVEVTLVDESHGRHNDDLMFDTCVLNDEEVFARQDMAKKEVSTADLVTTAGEVVTTANVEVSIVSPITATITTVELTLAKTLAELKSARPKTKGDKVETDYELAQRLQVEEHEELTIEEKSKLSQQLLEKRRKHFAAKRKPKDLKTKSFANVQELFDKAMKRVNTFVDMDIELVGEQEPLKKQKMEDDKETAELQSMMEVILDEEEVAVDAIPLATKPPSIVDWKIIKEGKIGYYQIIRVDGNSKRYSSMIQMLKSFDSFDREDLETLWKLHLSFLDWSRNSLRKAMYLNEVFGSILLVIMKLLIKKLDRGGLLGLKAFLKLLLLRSIEVGSTFKAHILMNSSLANMKCVFNVDGIRTILDICLRVEGVDFTDVPDDDATLAFLIELQRIGEDYQEYGLSIPEVMLNDAIKQSESYQMFIKYSTGQIPHKKSRGKGSQRKKIADDSQETVNVSEESKPEPVKRKTTSRRVVKKKVTIFTDDKI